jgi:hypothetical protein
MAPRRSTRSAAAAAAPEERPAVPAQVRDRQRAVAEREASRLARPEPRPSVPLAHADRKKSAVSSTPFGFLAKNTSLQTSSAAETQEWCGPFSVARQMIAKREEARRLREQEEDDGTMHHPLDAAMEELEMEKKRKAHPSMQWKGSFKNKNSNSNNAGSLYTKRQKRADVLQQGRAVPTLFDLCVKFLVDNFEHVESLGCDMDSQIRTAITNQLVSAQTLDGPSFQVIAEIGIEALEISDCSAITEEELSTRLRQLIPAGLRYLVLDQCGRCFTARAVTAITDCVGKQDNSNSKLFALSIGGAYSLKDADAARLVQCTAASSLEFKACNLVGQLLCESIADTYTSSTELLVELALEDIPLTDENLQALIAKPAALQNLKSLSLRRIEGLNDAVVTKMIEITAGTLEGLDLSENHQLTDSVLAGIRLHDVRRLHSLTLAGLKLLTAAGLEAFFTFVEGSAPPPMLTSLNLGNCDHAAVTDDVLHLATQAATQNRESDQQQQIALLGGMVHLNVQGSSCLTDTAMEYLVATSSRTLEELNVSFCPLVTDQGLGYLVDRCARQLKTLHVWGNAQLTDDFLDGNHRANDPSLEIMGVWMKKNTSRTIR